MEKQRVLILSASAGAGHIRAADAIEKAYRLKGDKYEVYCEDALKYTNVAFRNFYSKAYIEMVNSLPNVLGLIYDYADKPWKDETRRLTIDRMNTRPLVRLLKKLKPDIVICTHFLPAEIISYLICKGRIKTKLSIVVTDMDIHAMWLTRHYSRYFVALEETKEHLKMLNFNSQSVSVTGIPIDPVFEKKLNKLEMRQKFGLDPHLPTIYMSSGGFGVGKIEEIAKNLALINQPVQMFAMCGRNAELKEKLERLNYSIYPGSKLRIVPVSYTTKVDEYMSASDIVLGKPGGLTTAEALAKELAFVIVNPIPGQEERNADHLLEQGAAIRCNNIPTLAYKVESIISSPEKLKSMSLNSKRIAKPGAANSVIEEIEASSDTLYGIKTNHRCSSLFKTL